MYAVAAYDRKRRADLFTQQLMYQTFHPERHPMSPPTTIANLLETLKTLGVPVETETVLGWTLAEVSEVLEFALRAGPVPRVLFAPPSPPPAPAPSPDALPPLSEEERALMLDADTMAVVNIVNAAVAWARDKSATGAFQGMSAATAKLYDMVQLQQEAKGKHLKPRSKAARKRAAGEEP